MIYKQINEPIGRHINTGDVWLSPDGAAPFKRVYSRGRSWENVAPGGTHPDERIPMKPRVQEKDHGRQAEEGAGTDRAAETAPVVRPDGKSTAGTVQNPEEAQLLNERGLQPVRAGGGDGPVTFPPPLQEPAPATEPVATTPGSPKGPGIDTNGSEVL